MREGDTYVVNGAKTFISNGQNADLVVVAVRTSPARPRGSQPVNRSPILLINESSSATVRSNTTAQVYQQRTTRVQLQY